MMVMQNSDQDVSTFNRLVIDVLRLVTTDWDKPNTATLNSKDYRLEVEYRGGSTLDLMVNIYKKASGYFGAGEIKPGLIYMGGAKLANASEHITNTGYFTLAEMNIALQELYNREAGMVLPAKNIYELLEPFVEKDDKSTVFECGLYHSITVLDTGGRTELHVTKSFSGRIVHDYMIGFRKDDPNTAIRSKFGSVDKLPSILAKAVKLVEERKYSVTRRVKKNGRVVRTNREE